MSYTSVILVIGVLGMLLFGRNLPAGLRRLYRFLLRWNWRDEDPGLGARVPKPSPDRPLHGAS